MNNLPRFMSSHPYEKTFLFCLLITLLISTARITGAQTSNTDGATPTGLAPGGPAGSYALSGFENVNHFNGNLNFNLPLYDVRDRGGANYSITLPIEQKWRVEQFAHPFPNQPPIFTPVGEWWGGLKPGYGPGVMAGRRGAYSQWSGSENYCGQSATQFNQLMLTRLTFTAADGTEFELRDQLTGGQPTPLSAVPCESDGNSRGSVFVTADGSSATFISDDPIHDYKWHPMGLHDQFYPSGVLMLRDGTRYRIDGGLVTSMRNRNGNRRTFDYYFEKVTSITDSLGRQITITYAGEETQYDQITFNGFGGQARSIKIWKASLETVLRTDSSPQTYAQLFPNMTGASSSTEYDPERVSKVELPDGRAYQFRYNSYGELARVELPTGGSIEYDWIDSSNFGEGIIYRRVSERRLYKTGSTLENRTTYSDPVMGQVVEVRVFDAGSTLLASSKHYFHGNGLASLGNPLISDPQRSAISYPPWKEGREFQTELFDIVSGSPVLKRRVAHTFQQPLAGANWPLGPPETSDTAKPNSPQITQSVVTFVDTNQLSKQTFSYDRYSNQTDVYEYDFGEGAVPAFATRHTQIAYLTTNPANGLDYASPNPTVGSVHIRNLPLSQKVYSVNPANGSETLRAQSEILYDESAYPILPCESLVGWSDPGAARGVPTTTKSWLNTTGVWIQGHAQFDQVGNLRKSWDAKGNVSEIQYSATYHHAYPTMTTSPIPDPSGVSGSSTSFTATTAYDFSTGLVTSATDANNQVTTFAYNDLLDRLTGVIHPTGGGSITFTYGDSVGNLFVREHASLDATRVIESFKYFDGLGRLHRAYLHEGGGNYLVTDTEYDSLARNWRVSNPYRSGTLNGAINPSGVWTTTAYDALGRVLTVTTPDSAVVQTSYSGNQVTVTDQAGKARRSVTDALGRLIQVVEDPQGLAYVTDYTYDALDNLVKVTQGSQQRFFMYDSLKRLIRARNPEQGTLASLNLSDPMTGNSAWSVGYQYDLNGNLTQKTDARGVVSNFVYDALNRNTTLDYSDTATINPDVKRFYDGATNGKGRFWYFYKGGDTSTGSNVDHTAIDSYDALGKPLVQRQIFKLNGVWGPTYQVSRAYNLAGNVSSQTYPSGRSVTYNYDAAGRLADKDAQNLAFTGNLGDGVQRTYAAAIAYSEWGSLSRERFGTTTPLYHKTFYNIRGQLFDRRLSSVNDTWDWNRGRLILYYSSNHLWGQSGTDNNGNVRFGETWIPPENATLDQAQMLIEQAYNYDALNRLVSVTEQKIEMPTWVWEQQLQQSYSYDRWGNRTINAAQTWGTGVNNKQFTVDAATNRLGVPSGQTGVMSYDSAGNLTTDTYTGAGTRTYDAENRMISAADNMGQTSLYTYNAAGQRVRRKVGTGPEELQIYGIDGELLAEYPFNGGTETPLKEYGYRNGQLLITAESASTRMNLALATNGATATASSQFNGNYPASSTINGDRRGLNWNYGGGWNDGTINTHPDWLQIDFNGSKTIDEINVITLQDNPATPAEPTEAMTFTLYGLTGYSVQYWNGSAWITVTGGSATGNNKVWRKFTFSPITTTKIRVLTSSSPDAYSRITEVEAWGNGTPQPRTNFALGGITSASSTISANYPAVSTINGDRRGLNWNNGGGWNDDTVNTHPDWLQIDFNGSKTLDEINVITLQDNPATPAEPTEAMTFTLYGLTGYSVQYWNGSAWTTVPGGSVSGNNKVWRKFTFAPLTTTKIRVLTSSSPDAYSRLTEVEAWGPAETAASSSIRWLVPDHLGTPRIIVNQTGSLAGVNRHDYLPFGEELFAGTGGRTVAMGYSGDGVRQQFTQQERDVETGLDYFLARYYSNLQGRFMSPDEFVGGPDELFYFAQDAAENPTFYAELANPQSLNKYQYCLNNPLRYIDPDGHQQQDGKSSNIVDRIIKSANEILGSLFASLQRAAGKDGASEEVRRPGPYGNKDQIIQAYMDRVGESTEITMDVLMLFDVTGAGGASRSLLNYQFRDGDKTDIATSFAAVVLARGGGPVKIGFTEAKGLIGAWARDPVQNTIAASITYHFGKHGAEVGASNVWQYLRKAEGFAQNLRGARVIELENGAKRYVKKGYYLIKDRAGKIISYGRESQ